MSIIYFSACEKETSTTMTNNPEQFQKKYNPYESEVITYTPGDWEIITNDLGELETMTNNPEALTGTWFDSSPVEIWVGDNQPLLERGEAHARVTFQENGEFIYNRIYLGLHEGTSIEDTTSMITESGVYNAEEGAIEIILDKRILWSPSSGYIEQFELNSFAQNRYMDVTFEINIEELYLVYFTATDLISPEQETPGLDKFEEVYTKQ